MRYGMRVFFILKKIRILKRVCRNFVSCFLYKTLTDPGMFPVLLPKMNGIVFKDTQ